jgi:hypothetical protein
MPILYYKADTSKFDHDETALGSNIYDVRDNEQIVKLDTPFDGSTHPMWWDAGVPTVFYNMTTNPNFTSPARPYRADRFILQSAGPDGLYGTGDDVFNFDN